MILLALVGKAFGVDPYTVLCWEPRRLGWAIRCLEALQGFEARRQAGVDVQPVFVMGALSG